MKKLILIISCFIGFATFAQSKAQRELLSQTMSVKYAAFLIKDCNKFKEQIVDSFSLIGIDSKRLIKEAAIDFICNSKYSSDEIIPRPLNVLIEGDLGKSGFEFKGKEIKSDGALVDVNYLIQLSWIKIKKSWKLLTMKFENQ